MKKIVVLGGAGDMARVAVRKLLVLVADCEIVLADFDFSKAEQRARSLGERVRATRVDIFEAEGLREVIGGCDLVVNATGPYNKTGRPVLEACIDVGVDYIDFGDEDIAAERLLELDEAAKRAGISAFICAGIAPGVVNLLVKKCVAQLDAVANVEVAWVSGATPPDPEDAVGSEKGSSKGGAAVIDHMLFESVGTTTSFKKGRKISIPSFRRARKLAFRKPLGDYVAYELGHAEVITLPHFLPTIENLTSLGSIYPPYLNGVFQGVAQQVDNGVVTFDEAAAFLKAVDAGERPTSLKPYWGILKGLAAQIVRGELPVRHLPGLLKFAVTGAISGRSLGAIRVTVDGTKGSNPVRLRGSASFEQGGPDGVGNIDEVTGSPLAVFAAMILDGTIQQKGVIAPEACVDPDEFVRAAAPIGLHGLEALMSVERIDSTYNRSSNERMSRWFQPFKPFAKNDCL